MSSHSPPPTGSTNNHNNNNNYNPYVHYSPAHVSSSSSGNRQRVNVCGALNRCGKRFEEATRKAEVLADNLWNHLKTSPSFSDAAVARLAQGTKVLADGGYDKVFQQAFQKLLGEKLLHSYACYLSTASGPVIGTLYISNKRIAFCSDFPLSHNSSTGNPGWLYYKVVIQSEQLRTVNPSANRWNQSEKYIHIVTRDGHEFWFMGFISYDKALKNLIEAIYEQAQPSRD
ncbi:GRAM domain containing protein [Parasponia andersonii]|uniref:GRAM domain containing protein n=1 Tax=Parasponia andersonii TaxID=3476 RepID=A0A2P5DP60_PARAD|nr:GRAM domain containing protein [Parasponia andersonii]